MEIGRMGGTHPFLEILWAKKQEKSSTIEKMSFTLRQERDKQWQQF
jgi:hypothetical protein